ncbi:MAG: tRNA pseudouridine synthase B [Anaerovoracaceae bacterium]
MDGVLNLLKPAGMTSHDAVASIRRLFRTKKVGHTGTLDPMAVGVLPVCVGSATRAVEYLESDDKEYRCELLLGLGTDTCDMWGANTGGIKAAAAADVDDTTIGKAAVADVETGASGAAAGSEEFMATAVAVNAADVSEAEVRACLCDMVGAQRQLPPIYSAIRVNGKKLYEYARSGEAVEIKPRNVEIYSIKPISIFHEPGRILIDVHCSKGTYIRSLCRDIGDRLGCGAVMSELIRVRSGSFKLADSVTFEDIFEKIEAAEHIAREEIMSTRLEHPLPREVADMLLPVDKMLSGFGRLRLSETERLKYVNGGKIAFRNAELLEENIISKKDRFSNIYLVYDSDDRFIGTAAADADRKIYKVGKVFVR